MYTIAHQSYYCVSKLSVIEFLLRSQQIFERLHRLYVSNLSIVITTLYLNILFSLANIKYCKLIYWLRENIKKAIYRPLSVNNYYVY